MIKSKPAPPKKKSQKEREETDRREKQDTPTERQTEPEISHSIKNQSSKTGPDLQSQEESINHDYNTHQLKLI
jgi:hypothetical protein